MHTNSKFNAAKVKGKKVLVTGGAGFIGSNTTKLLCDLGYQVTVFDNLSYGHRRLIDKRAKFIKGDLRKADEIYSALKGQDVVFHFAAESIIKFSIENPTKFFDNNINGLITLLEAMRKQQVKYLVNSSSASVYGTPKRVPILEDDPKAPLQPYGASKLSAEAILSSYYYAFGINSTSLRYFNAYGPNDDQEPVTRAVPAWIKSILKNKPIPLYWQGLQLRDYVFVQDIALAHIAVMNLTGLNFFNVGSGEGILVKDLLALIVKLMGRKIKIIDLGERAGDPKLLVADIKKIKKAVGWEPQTNLAEGLKLTVDYYRKHSTK